MISIYTTGFNLEKINTDFDDVFSNWLLFADQIVIATFKDQEEKTKNINSKSKFFDPLNIAVVGFAPDIEGDIYWEGKLKNEALQHCYSDIVIQCDLDERISGDPELVKSIGEEILKHDFPCSVMLPTIDLYEDLDHYINIGYKWYIHKRQGTFRGAGNFAKKQDGTFDAEKSDTCELVTNNGDLIPCVGKINYSPKSPKIIHLGYLDLKERNKVNEFWGKIWDHRHTGKFNSNYAPEEIKSGDKRKQKHNLSKPLWENLK